MNTPLSIDDEVKLLSYFKDKGESLGYCSSDYIDLSEGMVVTDRVGKQYTLISKYYAKTSSYGGHFMWKLHYQDQVREVPERIIHLCCLGMILDSSLIPGPLGKSRAFPIAIVKLGLGKGENL